MENIKLFALLFLLFNFSNCLNEIRNTFVQTSVKTYCKNDGEESSLTRVGDWADNTTNIPESLKFKLLFNDTDKYKFDCTFTRNKPTEIDCPNARGILSSSTIQDQYMDENHEYFLTGNDVKINFDCSSLYIYINILLLLIILFILF